MSDWCNRWKVMNGWFWRWSAVIWTWGYDGAAGFRFRAALLRWTTIYTPRRMSQAAQGLTLSVEIQGEPLRLTSPSDRWLSTLHAAACSLSFTAKPQCDVTPLLSPLWALRDVPLLPSVTTPTAKTVKLCYKEHFFIWFYDIEGTFLIVWSTSYTSRNMKINHQLVDYLKRSHDYTGLPTAVSWGCIPAHTCSLETFL